MWRLRRFMPTLRAVTVPVVLVLLTLPGHARGEVYRDALGAAHNAPQSPVPASIRMSDDGDLLEQATQAFEQRQFDKAVLLFKELIEKQPAHPSSAKIREQLGDCYRTLAVAAWERTYGSETMLEKKAQYRADWQKNLELARDTYQKLGQDLDARAEKKALVPAEENLRRKAQFVVADCDYDLPDRFDAAFKRYASLFEKYRDQSDGLWACQRLYRCLEHATNAKLSNVEDVSKVAMAAVRQCLQNMKALQLAGAFRNESEKECWQQWLEKAQQGAVR
jgi:tetratricopeptide (TPR) repeat protein